MITCKLGEKTYCVDFITPRALREMGPADAVYTRIVKALADPSSAGEGGWLDKDLDTLVKWFCILFGNQFTPDDFYDNYPLDRAVHDIALAMIAVRSQTTEVLNTFPTTAAPATETTKG